MSVCLSFEEPEDFAENVLILGRLPAVNVRRQRHYFESFEEESSLKPILIPPFVLK